MHPSCPSRRSTWILPCPALSADRLAANVTKEVLEEVRQVKQVMGRLTGRVQRVKTELEVGQEGRGRDLAKGIGHALSAAREWWEALV